MEPMRDDGRPDRRTRWQRLASHWPTFLVLIMLGAAVPYLVDTFSRAMYWEESRQTRCMANEKNLALALLMYAQDNGDRLPRVAGWPPAVKPYINGQLSQPGSTGVFYCRSQRHPQQVPGIAWEDRQGLSYAMSMALPSGKVSSCPKPSEMPLLFDSDIVPAAFPYQAAMRHGRGMKGTDIAFLDGHVKWTNPVSLEDLPVGKAGR